MGTRGQTKSGRIGKARTAGETASVATITTASLYERGTDATGAMDALDVKRLELEIGAGGDHDLPYTFAFPYALPENLAWVKLLVKVQQDEIQS